MAFAAVLQVAQAQAAMFGQALTAAAVNAQLILIIGEL